MPSLIYDTRRQSVMDLARTYTPWLLFLKMSADICSFIVKWEMCISFAGSLTPYAFESKTSSSNIKGNAVNEKQHIDFVLSFITFLLSCLSRYIHFYIHFDVFFSFSPPSFLCMLGSGVLFLLRGAVPSVSAARLHLLLWHLSIHRSGERQAAG